MSLSGHIRTHVVGYVAVFLALSGSAHALAGSNTVDSGDIVASGVTTPDVAPNAVTGVKIADDTVGSVDLLNGGVRPFHLGAAVVNGAKVENGALNLDEFVPDSLQSRVTETCGGQAWRFFRLSEAPGNCASPVTEVRNTFSTILPGWTLNNNCTGTGNALLSIESTENFGTVNWFYSDGVALHVDGTVLNDGEKVLFNQSPISGQFILSNPGNGSSVPANAITVTYGGGGACDPKATAAVGLWF